MTLNKKLFHSIHSYICQLSENDISRDEELEDILYKLECVLKTGYILPYNETLKLYGNTISRNCYLNFNSDHMISLSLHKDNAEQIDIDYKECFSGDVEDAFQEYIIQEPSIVLNESIRSDLKFAKYNGIYLERLCCEPISLKYMEAISVFGSGNLVPFFYKIKQEDYEKYSCLESPRNVKIEYLYRIKQLLEKYRYNIPIVDICSGKEFKDNSDYICFLESKMNNIVKKNYIC